jgi:hypothetical protein
LSVACVRGVRIMKVRVVSALPSRREASNFENVGWRMIRDGSESPIVYRSSWTGWDVP